MIDLRRVVPFFCVAAALAAQGTTTAIVADADATILEDFLGGLANGGGSYLFCGKTTGESIRRTLLHFDVAAALPAGARVVAVELKLNISRSRWPFPLPVEIFRVTTPWTEGSANAPSNEGAGEVPNPGDVTWLHCSYPTLLWNTPGGDFAPVAIGVTDSPLSGTFRFPAHDAMVADVQQWLDAPAGNLGWLLKTDEVTGQAVRRFDSRSNLTVSRRPALLVTWILPGQWAATGSGCGLPATVLSVSGTLAPGGTATFLLQGSPGATAASLFELGLALPGLLLAPGCSWLLPPTAATPGLRVLDAAGRTTEVFAIPPSASYSGLPFAGQGAVLDPAQPAGFALSNAVFLTVL